MKVLWFNRDRSRVFLIPDEIPFSEGPFELRTSLGRELRVSEEAVRPFEVSKRQAADWSREALSELLTRKDRPAGDDAEAKSGQPPLTLLSSLSGEPAEALRSDPEALKKGLGAVGAQLGALLKDALSPSPEDKARAGRKLVEMKELVDQAREARASGAVTSNHEAGGGPAPEATGTGTPEPETSRSETPGSETTPPETAPPEGTETDEAEAAMREAGEKALRSVAGLAGTLAEAAERAGARFARAADELRERADAARRGAESTDSSGAETAELEPTEPAASAEPAVPAESPVPTQPAIPSEPAGSEKPDGEATVDTERPSEP